MVSASPREEADAAPPGGPPVPAAVAALLSGLRPRSVPADRNGRPDGVGRNRNVPGPRRAELGEADSMLPYAQVAESV